MRNALLFAILLVINSGCTAPLQVESLATRSSSRVDENSTVVVERRETSMLFYDRRSAEPALFYCMRMQ